MPFRSEKQRRFMFSQHPDIAKRWADEAKAKGEPIVQPGKQLATQIRKTLKPRGAR